MTAERMFPVLRGDDRDEYRRIGAPQYVPWTLLAPHEARALRNHDQSLETLASRGGLGLCEMVAILEDRRWRKMDQGEALTRLKEHIARHEAP